MAEGQPLFCTVVTIVLYVANFPSYIDISGGGSCNITNCIYWVCEQEGVGSQRQVLATIQSQKVVFAFSTYNELTQFTTKPKLLLKAVWYSMYRCTNNQIGLHISYRIDLCIKSPTDPI